MNQVEPTGSSEPGERSGPTGLVGARRGARVQSVERAARLLRAVATATEEESVASALAAACDLNRATAWRILVTLEAEGLVVCDRRSGRWSIAVGLLDLASTSSLDALVRSARSVLERVSLQTGETAALAVVRGGRLTYVEEVAPVTVVSASWGGRSVPWHATSTGKAMLAHLPRESVDRLLGGDLTRFTAHTITDRARLDRELEQIRACGFSSCRGEYEEHAYGVSAPVLDSGGMPLAMLSIFGPSFRLTEDRFAALGELAVEAAEAIARPGGSASDAGAPGVPPGEGR